MYAEFEGGDSIPQKNLEFAWTKFLIDKLTGKISRDIKRSKLPPLEKSEGEEKDGQESLIPNDFNEKKEKEEAKTILKKW